MLVAALYSKEIMGIISFSAIKTGSSLEAVGNKKAKFHEITNVTGIS